MIVGGYYEEDDDVGMLHTGVFVTEQEARGCERVHHADAAVSMLAGRPATPGQRIRALFVAYGLRAGDAANGTPIETARLAIHTASRELIYAWPAVDLTPTVSATFADGSTVTVRGEGL